jgi:hypothetical protein
MRLFIDKLKTAVRNPGSAARYATVGLTRNASVAVSSRYPYGTHPFDKEWDVLILLDTCRVDALRAVADEYEFLDPEGIERVWSVGGTSAEWMAATFDKRYAGEIADTAYIASNGHAKLVLEQNLSPDDPDKYGPQMKRLNRFDNWDVTPAEEIGRLEHVWKYEPAGERGGVGHPEGHSPPRYVTDRAVDIARSREFERLILHYNQPHSPYVANALNEERDLHEYEKYPWQYIQRTGDRETVFEAYLDDLRYVLDDVAILLDNVDAADVVISADHGEAFGEYGVYGHHAGSVHPHVRFVPWTHTSGTDNGTYTPEFEPIDEGERDVNELLEALGYK